MPLSPAMHQTIYFNNKPLFLCDTITRELDDYLHKEDSVFIDELNVHTVKAMIYEMELPKIHSGVFLHSNLDELLKAFKKKLFLVKAGGGVVHTDDQRVLMIFRRGKWDLPKGKLDEGESIEDCAKREVLEETGLVNIELEKPLTITYHTYHEGGKHILKESHWFMMKSAHQNELVPQLNEDIEKCEWVKTDSLQPYLENTHPSILDVMKKALAELGIANRES